MYNFTKEQIESAAASSESRTEMMRILGIRQGGGGYQTLDRWCREYNVTPPDGTALGRANVIKYGIKELPDDEWFVDGVRRGGPNTRKKLVRAGVPDECSMPGCPNPRPMWNSKPLTLQVDHINGNRWDNRRENVRLLCPNCHTQTETYSFNGRRRVRNYCECGTEITKTSIRCRHCESKQRLGKSVFDWPPVEEVADMVRLTNYSQAAKIIGVSDNGVKKFLERNGVTIK